MLCSSLRQHDILFPTRAAPQVCLIKSDHRIKRVAIRVTWWRGIPLPLKLIMVSWGVTYFLALRPSGSIQVNTDRWSLLDLVEKVHELGLDLLDGFHWR